MSKKGGDKEEEEDEDDDDEEAGPTMADRGRVTGDDEDDDDFDDLGDDDDDEDFDDGEESEEFDEDEDEEEGTKKRSLSDDEERLIYCQGGQEGRVSETLERHFDVRSEILKELLVIDDYYAVPKSRLHKDVKCSLSLSPPLAITHSVFTKSIFALSFSALHVGPENPFNVAE